MILFSIAFKNHTYLIYCFKKKVFNLKGFFETLKSQIKSPFKDVYRRINVIKTRYLLQT